MSWYNEYMQVITLKSHDVDEVMLGYDYLTDNRCVWDFGSNQIFIRGKPYTPFARHGPPKCRRVFETTNIVVPAKQQIDLPVRSTINSLKLCNGTFATEPRSIKRGIHWSYFVTSSSP